MCGDSLSCVAFAVVPETWRQQAIYDTSDGATVKNALLELYKDYLAEARQLIKHFDPASVATRNLYMLPPYFEWDFAPGATLIGDSVHLMLQCIGEGVKSGMRDSLAFNICQYPL